MIERGKRDGPEWFYRSATEKGDKRRPLPLRARGGTVQVLWKSPSAVKENLSESKDIPNFAPWGNGYNVIPVDPLMNKALGDIRDKVYEMQQIAVDWAERKKAISLGVSNAQRLLSILDVLASGSPKRIFRKLRKKVKKSEISDIPSLWLEYNFAIKPTIDGIVQAIDTLSRPIPVGVIKAKAKADYRYRKHRYGSFFVHHQGSATVTLSGKILVENPNTFLAAQYGLLNPLSMAWEIIPWSWAVDYFVNIGDFLMNFEPRFPGVLITDQYTTVYGQGSAEDSVDRKAYIEANSPIILYSYTGFSVNRRLGWPSVKLEFPTFDNLSVYRFSTLVSAISLTLKGKGK